MRRGPHGALLLATLLLAGACDRPDGGSVPGAGTDTAAAAAEPQPGPGSRGDVAVCLQGGPFIAGGPVQVGAPPEREAHDGDPAEAPGGSEGGALPADADRIHALRRERHEGCERLVLDLADAEGQPAERPGAVRAEVLRDLGVVRVTLADVEWVAPEAADATYDGPLVGAAFSVFAPEGRWVYVDVHLREPAEAAVLTLLDPARVVVDLRPGGGPVPEPASRGQGVVVLEPRPGEDAYPLTITGYARTFEANVVVRLEQDGEDVHQDFTTATSWADAWGHYAFTIEDGPVGSVVLHVGEHSARDGSWQGVAVPLEMR